MTAFHLKIIAVIAMIIDHTEVVFPGTFGTWGRVVGRIAFPIFVYLIAEGFRHTKSPWKFLLRLFVFAIISEPFFDVAIRGAEFPTGVDFLNNTNIFYTLFLGGLIICIYDYVKGTFQPTVGKYLDRILAASPIIWFMWLAEADLTTDYGGYGVLFIFLMYVIKPVKLRIAFMFVLCLWQFRYTIINLVEYFMQDGTWLAPLPFIMMIPAAWVAVLLVGFYNGKHGPKFLTEGSRWVRFSVKWGFYAFYPLHLMVLSIIAGRF